MSLKYEPSIPALHFVSLKCELVTAGVDQKGNAVADVTLPPWANGKAVPIGS
jgi:hypothetical protein